MVELAVLGVAHQGEIVGLVAAGDEGRHPQFTVHHLFREAEVQGVLEQLHGAVDVTAVEQAVVEALHRHAVGDLLMPRIGVHQSHGGAHVILLGIELEHVSGGGIETHPLAAVVEFTRRDALGGAAGILEPLLEGIQDRLAVHLEAHEIHPRGVGLPQHHREPVPLVPGLEVDAAAVVTVHLLEAETVLVVDQGLLHIQDPDAYMPRPHYACHCHCVLLLVA